MDEKFKKFKEKIEKVEIIPKGLFLILDVLKNTLRMDFNSREKIPSYEMYLSRERIIRETGLGKSTISELMKKYHDCFEMEVKRMGDKSNPYKTLTIYGLSIKGYDVWNNYWVANILPTLRKNTSEKIKNDVDDFIIPCSNKFISIKDEDMEKFFHTFNLSFSKIHEMPFEIKIKLKPKFKNKKDVYNLYMDKELAYK